jgi:serine/threonine-protein kinase
MIADGSLIADRYRVIGRLGQGGMGQVYLAEHVRMGRKSALKIMNPGMAHDPDAVNRFNREAANASRINHTNVASVYDFGETEDGLLFLAMEYVEGQPLSTIIAREGALPLTRAASIARQVAAALRVAHHLGIVHRDLKPDNIMIARDIDGSELVKVVDFGIAKAVANEGQKVTRTGLSIGTPEYMSPEQLASENVDARSDIYSLGLVTFAMLTGELPFPAVTTRETLVARLVDKPATLAAVRGDVAWPSGLQAVMDKVLASNAVDRYQDSADFAKDLAAALETPLNAPSGIDASAATRLAASISGARTVPSRPVVPPTREAPPSTPVMLSDPGRGRRRLMLGVVGGSMLLGLIAILAQYSRPPRRAARTVVQAPAAGASQGAATGASAGSGQQAPRAPTSATTKTPTRVRPDAPPGVVAPIGPATRPTPPQPPTRRLTLRDSTRIAADDVAVLRRAALAGDRATFQSAYRQAAVLIANLNAAHPRDPEVRATRAWMIGVRDSLRTRCRRDPRPCETLGLAVPAPLRRQRAP